MVEVKAHDPVLDGRFLAEYLELFGDDLRKRRRHYALFKVLKLFVEFSGCENLDQAIRKFKQNNGEGLHVAVQKTINFLKEHGKQGKPLAPKSVRQYVGLLKKFLEYYDIDTSRAWKKVKQPPKAEIRSDRPLELHEIQKLILASKSPRIRLLIQFLPQTGLRLNEALQLKVADIDFERGWIRVRAETTKNKKAREVPLIPELKDTILNYLKNRKIDSPYLFPNEKDPSKPMREKYVYDNLYSLLKRLGLDRRDPSGVGYLIHPHAFRKFYKTQLEHAGINPLLIERWMGHKRGIEAVYYLPNKEMIQEAVEKAAEALKIFGRKDLMETISSYDKAIEDLRRRVDALAKYLEDQERKERFIAEAMGEYSIPKKATAKEALELLKKMYSNIPPEEAAVELTILARGLKEAAEVLKGKRRIDEITKTSIINLGDGTMIIKHDYPKKKKKREFR